MLASSVDSCLTSETGSSVEVCLDCVAGSFSEQGSTYCNICSFGKYSSIASINCTSCPSGKFITDDSVTATLHADLAACIDCEAGKIANAPITASNCDICAFGKYSSIASINCTSCPSGKFITDDSVTAALHADLAACIDCDAGTFASEYGSSSCDICSFGKYSSIASINCTSCPSGKFITDDSVTAALHADLAACIDCEAGKMANDPTTASNCDICTFGKYSSIASINCTSCPSGKFITDDSVTATLHADLAACVDCDGGKSSTAPASSCPLICPPGTYAAGTPCTSCSAGKFNENEQQESCINCGSGRYSVTVRSTIESDCRNCEPGKASAEEVRGSPCEACPVGTAAPAPGLGSCPGCQAGTYSNNPDGAISCELCEVGKYIAASGSSSCDDCGAGTYNLIQGSITCDKCPAGQKMNIDGNGCDICPNGKFSNPGSTFCTDCNHTPGYVSLAGEEGAAACEYCGPGFYADQTSQICKECEIDSYSVGGVDSCEVCPSGTNNIKGSTSCSPCSPGEIIEDQTCQKCEKGKYATFGMTVCAPCSGEGEYSDTLGTAVCRLAPAGHKPNSRRDGIVPCEEGYVSFGGVTLCKKCDGKGQYADETGLSVCKSAPEGHKPNELRDGIIPCEVGYASFGGATLCKKCDGEGQYADETGLSACKSAPAGNKPDADHEGLELCTAGKYSIGGSTLCMDCGPGKLSLPGAVGCSVCSPGEAPINQACVTCEPGKYAPFGSESCLSCSQAGQYSRAGASACSVCNTGKYYDENQNACFSCPKGSKSPTGGVGIEQCLACEEGFYSDSPGSSACFACNPGKFTNLNQTACLSCPPGEISGVAASVCATCEEGKFTEGEGNSECISCQPGSYSNADQTGCDLCPAGKFSGVASSTICTACDAGKYAEVEGNSECTKCPDYQTSSAGASTCECKDTFLSTIDTLTSELACTCAPGTTLENGVCVPCAAGFYKSSTSLEACTSCNKFAIEGAVQSTQPATSPLSCICSKGDFRVLEPPANSTKIGQCKICPEGTLCHDAGVTIDKLPLKRGFWRSGFDSSNVVKCYTEDACSQTPSTKFVNITNPIDEQCAGGHTGPICNVCLTGYAKNFLGICETCQTESFYIPPEGAVFVAVLVAFFLATIYFYYSRKSKKKSGQGRLDKFRKRTISKSSLSRSASNGLTAAHNDRDHWFYRARTKAKIMLSFTQILTSFEGVLEIRFPPIFEKFIRLISSTVNLDALQLARVDCIVDTDFYSTLLAQTLLPLIISVCIFLCFLVAKCASRGSRERQAHHADTAWSTFLTLTFIVFSSVSTTIFDTFNCNQIGDDPHYWLARDHSVDCKSPEHLFYKTYATFMIMVYPVGIPTLYLILLFRNRKRLQKADRDYDPKILKISFLWQNYEPGMWWFEVFECARRLGMSGVLVFVAQGSASQIVVGLLISVITSGLYIHWRPFEKESDDNLAIFTQISLYFTLLAALLRKVDVDKTDNYNQSIFGIMLIVINLSSVALIILSQFTKPFHYLFDSMLGTKHSHDGVLKGVEEEEIEGQQAFSSHFLTVAKCSFEEGGWMIYSKKGEDWANFLDYSGVTFERRCSTGNGFIDETRAVFVVKWDFERIKNWLKNEEKELRHGVVEYHEVNGRTLNAVKEHTNNKFEYMARKMKGWFRHRDYLLECIDGTAEDGEWFLIKRSIEDKTHYSVKRSHSLGRARAKVLYEGWVLHNLGPKNGVRVTYLENVDPGGIFKGRIVDKVMPSLLRDRIDDLLAHIDEQNAHGLFSEFERGEADEGLEMSMISNKLANTGGLVLGGTPRNPIAMRAAKKPSKKGGAGSGGRGKLKVGEKAAGSPTSAAAKPAVLDLRGSMIPAATRAGARGQKGGRDSVITPPQIASEPEKPAVLDFRGSLKSPEPRVGEEGEKVFGGKKALGGTSKNPIDTRAAKRPSKKGSAGCGGRGKLKVGEKAAGPQTSAAAKPEVLDLRSSMIPQTPKVGEGGQKDGHDSGMPSPPIASQPNLPFQEGAPH
ncbi:hypothetical protein TrLO_g10306 [Triparma laevis f. longispina]|uniref:Tyrosine-protein kinase ephrin type A/B receptor-like domain-containing protein n=1 Tax=Triparma laevis f. longispina TaxID=1714387 RepID=A0A9W7EG73_9STRA|nr:hypothetical protein TrLO_g10306 [Triparma laevis f. longispina]